jgi:spore coat polysaccharide biosynthesis protein SpsF
MITALIVQARMASARLPGKVMLPLGGKSVLRHVLGRCSAVPGVDTVMCAVSDDQNSDIVAGEAAAVGVRVYRGSEADVLDRYFEAARSVSADVVVRVTSDCPLIDPVVCGEVIKLRERTGADYAANNFLPGWPHGLDCEVFLFEWLERAWREAKVATEREHVTPFIRLHPEVTLAGLKGPDPEYARHRWTLDTPSDQSFFEVLFSHLPNGPDDFNFRVPLAIVESYPEIAALNAGAGPKYWENCKVSGVILS